MKDKTATIARRRVRDFLIGLDDWDPGYGSSIDGLFFNPRLQQERKEKEEAILEEDIGYRIARIQCQDYLKLSKGYILSKFSDLGTVTKQRKLNEMSIKLAEIAQENGVFGYKAELLQVEASRELIDFSRALDAKSKLREHLLGCVKVFKNGYGNFSYRKKKKETSKLERGLEEIKASLDQDSLIRDIVEDYEVRLNRICSRYSPNNS